MKTNRSGAKYSAIVGIGEELNRLSAQTGKEYLPLNRGVNSVTLLDLNPIISEIDFNSKELQLYPANSGIPELKEAINQEYFAGKVNTDHIYITNGGMSALDLIIGSLDCETIYAHNFHWGAYRNISISNQVALDVYPDFDWLYSHVDELAGNAIIICDPNNPLGTKYDDDKLLDVVKYLTKNDVTVIWDGPYRRLFLDHSDTLYQELAKNENLIITESFSKSIGLPGQRLGFIYVKDQDFGEELNIKILYTTNGINTFAQLLVTQLFSTTKGQEIISDFKKKTVEGITQNIAYLKENDLLVEQYYQDATPVGIFVVIKKTYQELLDHRIGSVPLDFFTPNKEAVDDVSRICVSVAHEKFVEFFKVFERELVF